MSADVWKATTAALPQSKKGSNKEKMQIEISKNNVLIYIAYILINLYYGITDTVLNIGGSFLILVASLGLTMVHIMFRNKFSVKRTVLVLALLGMFAYNYLHSKDSRMLALIITIVGIKDLELENVLKVTFYEKIIVTLMVMAASVVGIGNASFGPSPILGFSHGNLLMLTITVLIMLYLCIYWKKVTGKILLALLGFIFMAFLITGSRSGLLISLAIWGLGFLYKYYRIERFLEIAAKYAMPVLMLLNLHFALSTSQNILIFLDKIPGFAEKYNQFVLMLDEVLTHRFKLANLVMTNSDISWLGSVKNERELAIYKYLVVDSGYIQLLLVFGILGTVLFLLLNHLLAKELIKRRQYVYIIALIGISLYAFTENALCSLKYNFTLLFFILFFQPDVKYKILNIFLRRDKK